MTTHKNSLIDGGYIDHLANETKDFELTRDLTGQEASILVDATTEAGQKDAGVVLGSWITISPGTFIMGSPIGEACRLSDETQHQVTLTHSIEIQTTEVTQGQFQTLMGYNPSTFPSCGSTCPVEMVNWHEAAAYCNALSTKGGYAKCYDCTGSGSSVTCSQNASYASGNIYNCPGYRLPTEAEWEYAYRAGTTTSLHNNTNVVNCSSSDVNANLISWNGYNSSSTPHPVGSKLANNWGLIDMAGNVWEWCNDWWDNSTPYGTAMVTDPWGQSLASNHVIRGGSWGGSPLGVRAGSHSVFAPANGNSYLGFRCFRSN